MLAVIKFNPLPPILIVFFNLTISPYKKPSIVTTKQNPAVIADGFHAVCMVIICTVTVSMLTHTEDIIHIIDLSPVQSTFSTQDNHQEKHILCH